MGKGGAITEGKPLWDVNQHPVSVEIEMDQQQR